jgi:hypothetical protein
MTWVEFTLRILAAGFLAGIGIERQWRQRLAGLRTNALVAVGAAAFVTPQPSDSADVDVRYLVEATCLEADEQRFRGPLLRVLSQTGLSLPGPRTVLPGRAATLRRRFGENLIEASQLHPKPA